MSSAPSPQVGGASIVQELLHPSPSALLPSSHSSPLRRSTLPSPHVIGGLPPVPVVALEDAGPPPVVAPDDAVPPPVPAELAVAPPPVPLPVPPVPVVAPESLQATIVTA